MLVNTITLKLSSVSSQEDFKYVTLHPETGLYKPHREFHEQLLVKHILVYVIFTSNDYTRAVFVLCEWCAGIYFRQLWHGKQGCIISTVH